MLRRSELERLSGQDAGFLYVESSTLFMHTLKLLVLRPSEAGERQPPEVLLRDVAARLLRYRAFRRRVVEVPFGLHHPVWIEDERVDLRAHVGRVFIPPPGGRAELDEAVAGVAARPLDRTRPLWELWLLEGLEDGSVGLLLKLHHAVADGVAAMRILTGALAPRPAPDDAAPPRDPTVPGRANLVLGALADHVRQAAALPALLARTSQRLSGVLRSEHAPVHAPIPVVDAPRTSFNRPLSPSRSFASATLSLEGVHQVKSAFGVTFNDVVLALVSGGVRHYLQEQAERPARSLIASVPMSDDGEGGGPRYSGNRLSNLFATLATDIDDPVERLREIHSVAAVAKARSRALGMDLVTAWSNYVPPLLLGLERRIWGMWPLGGRVPPPINLVVSNVPGPREPLALPGWDVTAIHSGGPVLESIGLNITVWSYGGGLHVGALACRDLLPEPARITKGMALALSELEARAS